MKTLGIKEAAKFLHMSEATLRRKAHCNEIPARKPGRCWVFLDDHLAEWLKGDYSSSGQELRIVDNKKESTKKCQSIRAVKRKHGGFNSLHQTADEYNKLLGL